MLDDKDEFVSPSKFECWLSSLDMAKAMLKVLSEEGHQVNIERDTHGWIVVWRRVYAAR